MRMDGVDSHLQSVDLAVLRTLSLVNPAGKSFGDFLQQFSRERAEWQLCSLFAPKA